MFPEALSLPVGGAETCLPALSALLPLAGIVPCLTSPPLVFFGTVERLMLWPANTGRKPSTRPNFSIIFLFPYAMTSESPTLLVLAAGMGARYGGLKQLEAVGPDGETLMDYAIYDAHRAGFSRVVFLIRRDIAEVFETQIGSRYAGRVEVSYAYQELDDLPEGFTVPEERERPWGTGSRDLGRPRSGG